MNGAPPVTDFRALPDRLKEVRVFQAELRDRFAAEPEITRPLDTHLATLDDAVEVVSTLDK